MVIDTACRDSPIGKLTPSALYVHESAVEGLPVPLRLFEGCARGYLGRVEGASVVKLHRQEPKVSYLSYPDFEADPHPALAEALTVNLRSFGGTRSTGTRRSCIARKHFWRRIIRCGPSLRG